MAAALGVQGVLISQVFGKHRSGGGRRRDAVTWDADGRLGDTISALAAGAEPDECGTEQLVSGTISVRAAHVLFHAR